VVPSAASMMIGQPERVIPPADGTRAITGTEPRPTASTLRQRWHENNVRVRLVPKIRLEALTASMDLARKAARHESDERARR
ncbi:MAG: hypothetical protein LC790_03830, partial [Actinobacteria bacterium]|nr:hypothetical protein [Actinomycetota bacterium]